MAANKNYYEIVGTLAQANDTVKSGRDGRNQLSVDTTIKTADGGEYDINFFAYEGGKMYPTYAKIHEMIGSRVKVTGELRENRFWSKTAKQIISTVKPRGSFINQASADEKDHATFDISGFLLSGISEHKNKAGELLNYSIQVGQANYANKLNVLTLHIEPTNTAILNGIKTFELKDTLSLHGRLDFTSEQVTKVDDTKGSFGDPSVRTYINRIKNFYITGGGPVAAEDAYTSEQISELITGYKENDKTITERANEQKESASEAASTPKMASRQASLI